MKNINSTDIIKKEQIILLCAKTLRLYDERLVDHGERVAYIAAELFQSMYPNDENGLKNIIILSLFHDVGAYKTDEIDRMIEFESNNVMNHSIYGYLFIKYFTPLGDLSEAILYHHVDYRDYNPNFKYGEYSCVIHLADRIDIAIAMGASREKIISMLRGSSFFSSFSEIMVKLHSDVTVYENIISGNFKQIIIDKISSLDISREETIQYLKMLVFTIDFKSEYTIMHSVNTCEMSVFLAKKMKLSTEQTEKIYYAALIHDIGKMAIPESILESPNKLNNDEMTIMRQHVVYTEKILDGVIMPEIRDIAVRHHEKLNGSGYPHGLKSDILTVSDRIVAIADIISALISKRSYKDNFSKELTLEILIKMASDDLIDSNIVSIICDCFDELQSTAAVMTAPLTKLYHDIQSEYMDLIRKM